MPHANWGHERWTARTDRGLSARSGAGRRRCPMGSFVRRRFHPLRAAGAAGPRSGGGAGAGLRARARNESSCSQEFRTRPNGPMNRGRQGRMPSVPVRQWNVCSDCGTADDPPFAELPSNFLHSPRDTCQSGLATGLLMDVVTCRPWNGRGASKPNTEKDTV